MSKTELLSLSRKVMASAWSIARAAALRFGGRASSYIRESVSLAWKAIRTPARKAAEKLVAALAATGLRPHIWQASSTGEIRVYVLKREGCIVVGQAWSCFALESKTARGIWERWAVVYGRPVV